MDIKRKKEEFKLEKQTKKEIIKSQNEEESGVLFLIFFRFF